MSLNVLSCSLMCFELSPNMSPIIANDMTGIWSAEDSDERAGWENQFRLHNPRRISNSLSSLDKKCFQVSVIPKSSFQQFKLNIFNFANRKTVTKWVMRSGGWRPTQSWRSCATSTKSICTKNSRTLPSNASRLWYALIISNFNIFKTIYKSNLKLQKDSRPIENVLQMVGAPAWAGEAVFG